MKIDLLLHSAVQLVTRASPNHPKRDERMAEIGLMADGRFATLLSRVPVLLVGLAIVLAAFFRFFRLDQIPPGFTFDEASHALDALDILNGRLMLLSPRLQETFAGYMYLVAAAFHLFGDPPVVQRGVTAFFGVLLIPLNFVLVRQMFKAQAGQKAVWLAALSSVLLATSFWAVFTSRIGYEYILTSVLAELAALFFWRGYSAPRWGLLFLAALFTAATLYFYNAAAPFLLVIPTTILLYKLLQSLWPQPFSPDSQVQWRVLIVFFGVVLLLTLPAFLSLMTGPNPEAQRSASSFLFVKDPAHPAKEFERLVESLLAHAQTFLGWHGDDYWWGGRPIFDPILGGSLLLGLLISLTRLRQLPYLFALVYWGGMLSAAVLTFASAVNHFRMSGALPATYLLIAIAWVELYGWLKKLLAAILPAQRSDLAAYLALIPFLLLSLWLPFQTYQDYFVTWANSPAAAISHDVAATKLVERMEQERDPQAIFLLRRLADSPRPNYILDFLYQGDAPLRYVPMDKAALFQTLTATLANYQTVHLITRLSGGREALHDNADPESLLPLLFSENGQLVATEDSEDYTILTYRLVSNRVVFKEPKRQWELPAKFKPLEVVAAGLKLAGIYQQRQADNLLVELAWQGRGKILNDYTISLQLLDQTGRRVTGVDVLPERSLKTLGLNELIITPFSLPLTPEVKPGQYTLLVGLYYFSGDQMISLGSIPLSEPVIIQ